MRFVLLAILYHSCNSAPVLGSDEDCEPEEVIVKEETYEQKFLRADKNRDKKLDFGEFLYTELPYVEAKKREFKIVDKNGDGFVTRKEYNDYFVEDKNNFDALRIKYLGELFEEFDEDFDMSLSQDEVKRVLAKRFMVKPRANFARLFSSFDKDRSGKLDVFEYMEFDSKFPFEETDPVFDDLLTSQKQVQKQKPFGTTRLNTVRLDERDANTAVQTMTKAGPNSLQL